MTAGAANLAASVISFALLSSGAPHGKRAKHPAAAKAVAPAPAPAAPAANATPAAVAPPVADPPAAPLPTVAAAPAASSDWPGPKSATARAEKTEVRLGEPFTVTIEIRHAKGERWSLQGGQKLDPFKLRDSKEVATGDPELTRLSVELALFQLGPHDVPDLVLLAQAAGAAPHELRLPGPTIKGVDHLGKDRERRDIKGPVPYTVTTLRPLLYLGGALALGLLAWWLARAWARRARRQVAAVVPAIPEDQVALTALTALEGEALPAGGHVKEFHLRLSEILRRYLGDRYGILALDMTSEELYRMLARTPSDGLVLADLQWVCQQGDLAKFAKGAPSVDDCRQALHLVRQLVQRTRRHVLANAAPTGPASAAGVAA